MQTLESLGVGNRMYGMYKGLHVSVCVSVWGCFKPGCWESKLRPHAYVNTLLAELSFLGRILEPLQDHLPGQKGLQLLLLRISSTES